MANNRKIGLGRQIQVVYSEPRKIFVEQSLSPKGLRLYGDAETMEEKASIWKKYAKNRYRLNPDAKPVKVITHRSN